MLKNKKFLIISLLTVILLVFSVSNCFAGSIELSSEELDNIQKVCNDLNLPDFIIYETNFGNHIIFIDSFVTGPLYKWHSPATGKDCLRCSVDNSDFRFPYGLLETATSGNSSAFKSLNNYYSWIIFGYDTCTDDEFASHILYSTVDIYTDSTCSTLLFQVPPVVEAQGVVAPQLEGVQMTQVMTEVVGFLPLAIGLLVLAIGLRKALQTLSTILKNS